MEHNLSKLEKKLGVTFNDKDYLLQALTHRSYLNEHPEFPLGQNERLEFLGDAVLELVVTESLFLNYKNPEGELTNWRASLVNARTLAEVCKGLGVEEFLLLSKGEQKDVGKARMYILANTMEALLGAMYLDLGWDGVKKFITDTILIKLPYILENKLYMDPKSKFQEIAQDKTGITPTYKVITEEGPDHAKVFTVGVYLDNELVEEGEGTSKQEAQTQAAKKALKKKGW